MNVSANSAKISTPLILVLLQYIPLKAAEASTTSKAKTQITFNIVTRALKYIVIYLFVQLIYCPNSNKIIVITGHNIYLDIVRT